MHVALLTRVGEDVESGEVVGEEILVELLKAVVEVGGAAESICH